MEFPTGIGSAEAMMQKAADLGQRRIKGVSGEFVLKLHVQRVEKASLQRAE